MAAEVNNNQNFNANALMRELDRESATRIWEGKAAVIIKVVTVVFSIWYLYSTLFSTDDLRIRLSQFLGFVILIGFLQYPANKKHVIPNYVPWYDIALMVSGAFSFFYYSFNFRKIVFSISSAAKLNPFNPKSADGCVFYLLLGIVSFLVICELCRRCVGLPILCVCSVLLLYALCTKGLWDVIYTLFYTTEGIMGTPIQVCAKYIAVFIIFGSFLEHTGISEFFIGLANSIAGSASGGPAKVAVISSALCGVVSGSSVGNTVTTGSVTIPMMKKIGYKPDFAGAVEATSSTGGQIMPPIMGAAAFLMSEYMGLPYGKVALYAILPALLYFAGIFVAVHLEGKKLGLKGLSNSQRPNFLLQLKKIYLLLPIVLLVWMVSSNTRSMQFSASIAILLAIGVSIPSIVFKARKDSDGKINIKNVFKNIGKMVAFSLDGGGRGCITVATACAIAGTVAGCITVTGLASRIVSAVISISNYITNPALSTIFALFLTMICCIVLGMGVPTTANYCIMASTCAPILIGMGVPVVAAHFFVFYFGIVSDITPPVALAAYAGSAIAKADPIKTGIQATKLAIAAFIVPYIFALNPTLLLVGVKNIFEVVQIVVTSLIGIFGISGALCGYVFKQNNILERFLYAVGGMILIIPETITDCLGLVIVISVCVYDYLQARGKQVVNF